MLYISTKLSQTVCLTNTIILKHRHARWSYMLYERPFLWNFIVWYVIVILNFQKLCGKSMKTFQHVSNCMLWKCIKVNLCSHSWLRRSFSLENNTYPYKFPYAFEKKVPNSMPIFMIYWKYLFVFFYLLNILRHLIRRRYETETKEMKNCYNCPHWHGNNLISEMFDHFLEW